MRHQATRRDVCREVIIIRVMKSGKALKFRAGAAKYPLFLTACALRNEARRLYGLSQMMAKISVFKIKKSLKNMINILMISRHN